MILTRKTVFLHIGKAGGTSIHSALCENIDPKKIFPFRYLDPGHTADLSIETLAKYTLFSGHFYVNLIEKFDIKPILMVFLREPISHFRAIRRQLSQEPSDPFYRAATNLSEIQIRNTLGHLSCNNQTRAIHRFLFDDAEEFEMDRGYNSPEMLSRIISKIELFDIFGTIETANSALLFYNQMGGVPAGKLKQINVSPKSELGGNIDVDYILQSNSLDIALYSYASTRTRQLELEFSNKSWLEYAIPRVQEKLRATGIPQILFGKGWYGPEMNRLGAPSKWSKGREPAELTVFAPSSLANTQQEIILFVSDATVFSNEISIYIRNVKVSFQTDVLNNDVVRFMFSASVDNECCVNIRIKSPSRSFYEIDFNSLQTEQRALNLHAISINGIKAEHYFG